MRVTGVFSALLAAVCLLLPSLAIGQETTFVVHMVRDAKAKYGGTVTIWTANCGKLDAKAKSLSCTLEQNTCTDNCAFTQKSTDLPPMALVFGQSTYNPTCAYVWDPWGQRYIFRC